LPTHFNAMRAPFWARWILLRRRRLVICSVHTIPLSSVDPPAEQPTRRKGKIAGWPLGDFIAGPENALARVAIEHVLSRQGPSLVLFYGPAGMGKSLISQGIYERVAADRGPKRVSLMTGADFARAHADASDTDAVEDFVQRFVGLELFILDDLEDLAGKAAAQRTLLTLLDQFEATGARIVVTSDRSPLESTNLEPRLASMLSAGLSSPLELPGEAARRTIFTRLAASRRITLDNTTIDLLAQRVSGTVLYLHSLVAKLESESNEREVAFDAQLVQSFLAEQQANQRPTLAGITNAVGKYFNVKSPDLRSASRKQSIVRARGVAVFLARKHLGESLEKIGQQFGGRDHTTILHALRTTEAQLHSDPIIDRAVREIESSLFPTQPLS
jgi:chromosomal replication initiator protein